MAADEEVGVAEKEVAAWETAPRLWVGQVADGRDWQSVIAERERLVHLAERRLGARCVPIDFFRVEPQTRRRALEFLGDGIRAMAEADLAVFASDWRCEPRLCVEMLVCREYGLTCYVEGGA